MTAAAQLRFLAAATDLDRRDLLSLASAVAGRRLDDLDTLTESEVQRLATQLNRRMACDPLVLARADAGDPVRLASIHRLNDYRLDEETP